MPAHTNKNVFTGHKTLLGGKHVSFEDEELPLRFDLYPKSKSGFDWGHNGPASIQLAFSILYQVSDKETAQTLTIRFTQEVVKKFTTRDWTLDVSDVHEWIKITQDEMQIKPNIIVKKATNHKNTDEDSALTLQKKFVKKTRPRKDNIVKNICKDLHITQKQLAEILEVPEGTVSSWAVKNEIPRLGKKAIEFYTVSTKNQKIVDSYKDFIHLLQAS